MSYSTSQFSKNTNNFNQKDKNRPKTEKYNQIIQTKITNKTNKTDNPKKQIINPNIEILQEVKQIKTDNQSQITSLLSYQQVINYYQSQFVNDNNNDFLLENWEDYFYEQKPTKFDGSQDYKQHLVLFFYSAHKVDKFLDIFEWIDSEYHVGFIYQIKDFQQLLYFGKSEIQQSQIDQEYIQEIQSTSQLIFNHPSDLIPALCLALDHIRVQNLKQKRQKITIRFKNTQNITNYAELKSNIIGNFISIKGVVQRSGHVRVFIKKIEFECLECNKCFEVQLIDGIFNYPSKCITESCKTRQFSSKNNTIQAVLYQRIKIQGYIIMILEIDDQSGKIPLTIECELQEKLVGKIISGEIILVNGILKAESSEENKVIKNKQQLFSHFIEVNSFEQNQQEQIGFTENDLKIFQTLAETPDLFSLLIKSFCPSIFGHEIVKAGLLLSILGGSSGFEQQQFRTDSHILLVGDPGLGKSQLLKFAAQISNRSVYVSGNNVTTAGLTASVSKDGENALEAGAVVISDQGICCIDEFDKMQSEHIALLEAMERQTITITKSGVQCTLQARCSILATANPTGGVYQKGKSIKDNLKIKNAILSRFDLIFLMLDNPDPLRDQQLSEHIMKLHHQKKGLQNDIQQTYSQFQQNFNSDFEPQQIRQNVLFLNEHYQLQGQNFQQNQILDTYLLKKYIKYAKQYQPSLSQQALEIIKDFYINLRENQDQNFPVTTRQLESLVRLSQARAKVDLRNYVTEEDALEIVQLIQESLFDAMQNCQQNSKKQVITNINLSTLSIPKQTKAFLEKLNEIQDEKQSGFFDYNELVLISKKQGLNVGNFGDFIEKLNYQNYLILKGKSQYQLNDKRY